MSTTKPSQAETCGASVFSNYSSHRCGKRAKVERDGRHYCGTHDPAKAEKRNAEWRAKFDAEQAARAAKELAQKEMERKADCFDDLLAALQFIERGLSLAHPEGCAELNKARAAIAKAGG